MGVFAIIMAIIQAIPSVIKLVQMIRDLLKNRTKEERAMRRVQLKGILARWREHRDSKETARELEVLLKDMQEGE